MLLGLGIQARLYSETSPQRLTLEIKRWKILASFVFADCNETPYRLQGTNLKLNEGGEGVLKYKDKIEKCQGVIKCKSAWTSAEKSQAVHCSSERALFCNIFHPITAGGCMVASQWASKNKGQFCPAYLTHMGEHLLLDIGITEILSVCYCYGCFPRMCCMVT